jgi:hypothetical protein
LQKRSKDNIAKILYVLKTYGPMHIRGIAKEAKMHPITVSTLVSRFGHFFEAENVEVLPGIEGMKVKIVRLKNPNLTIDDVERYMEVKKQIKNV